ncbi:MAG: RNA-guided endonuclease InsQ/TnpB family protein [Candidatus Hodarchaeales archaeon]|jgi:transposase
MPHCALVHIFSKVSVVGTFLNDKRDYRTIPRDPRAEGQTMTTPPSKKQAIKVTLAATKARRETQVCRVYALKINRSKMNATSRAHFIRLFLEAKWFYNWVVSQPDVFNVATTVQTVPVKVGEAFEERELRCLSSQMKQGLVTQIHQAIRALAALKKTGHKVGKLKFKSFLAHIPLKQYGITYQLDRSHQRIRLQKAKQWLRVHGCAQIPAEAELANAHLLRRHGDYYFHVVTYQPKTRRVCQSAPQGTSIGIDTGLQTQFAFSNGVAVEYRIPFPERLRRLYRQFSRTQKGSHNRRKVSHKLQKAFAKLTNRKKEIRNQLIAYLVRNYEIICFQDELLRAWQRVYGKKMADLSLGAFLRILKERSRTPMEVRSAFPSTQRCSGCGHKQRLSLEERTYWCPLCRFTIDRDLNAAVNLRLEGLGIDPKNSPSRCPERNTVMPVETKTATQRMLDHFNGLPFVRASLVAEAGSLTALA